MSEKLSRLDVQEQIDRELTRTIIIPFLKNFILAFKQLEIQSPTETVVQRIKTATRYARAKTSKLSATHQTLVKEMIHLGKISNPNLEYGKAIEVYQAQLTAFEEEIYSTDSNHD